MSSGNIRTCANCGNEVREGARFCPSCGAPVVQAAAEPSRAEPPPPPSPGGKRRLRWVAIGVAVAVLVAGGAAAAALLITGGDDSTQAAPTEETTTDALSTEPVPGELSDEAVTALINEAMSQRTEVEFGVLGGAPLGAEVRDCHKDVSESSLLDPGETQWTLYACEIWYEGELSEDVLLQSVDSDGNLYGAGDTTFGDETTAEEGVVGGEDVDETCAGYVAFATLARRENPNPSVDDVERLAAIASDLASKGPAEPSETGIGEPNFLAGEPKKSIDDIAEGLESYARLLAELGLAPGSDTALAEPRIAEVIDGIEDADVDLTRWFEERCSEEDHAAFEKIRNG